MFPQSSDSERFNDYRIFPSMTHVCAQLLVDGRNGPLSTLDAQVFALWSLPLSSYEFNMLTCSTEDAGYNWHYKDTFIRSDEEIESMINEAIKSSHQTYLNDLGKIAGYL
uniref:Uncharacterized protein n=1 Tax=Parascaris equorum TaxID=6256 RepID=A0A914S8H6_PAREQ